MEKRSEVMNLNGIPGRDRKERVKESTCIAEGVEER